MKRFWGDKEDWLILLVWLGVYTFDMVYMWYTDISNGMDFHWKMLAGSWTTISVLFLLYAVHHYVLVKHLFLRKRFVAYIIWLGVCLSLFTTEQIVSKPHHPKHVMDVRPHRHRKPRMLLPPPEMARVVIAMMMIGVDLGIVAWTNSMKLRRRLMLLEQQNLRQELEHLRYQINPHFFMNTLNNIHVLVDVDQERAKKAIIELSGLMRHSLYNGSKGLTPLQNEIDFLRQYISLMQLRFDNRVSLKVDLPDAPSQDIVIPPLLYATFVENAFKHGISYQTPSYIDISMVIDEVKKTIVFKCRNSRNHRTAVMQDEYHGIGLDNVRKRLELQYGSNYSLDINDDDPQQFEVELVINS